MYRLKAFGAFPPLSNNEKDKVNRLGELHTYSETFAEDRGIYKDISKPNSLLVTFSSLNEISSVLSEEAPVPPSVADLCLTIMENLYDKAIHGDFDSQEPPVREYMLTQWQGIIKNVVVNEMVTDGNQWLPSSVIFEGTSTTSPFQVQLWFSDERFRAEYDNYVIKVVLPIDNIDRFFDTATNVQKIVSTEMTLTDQMRRANEMVGTKPPTIIQPTEFDWVDPTLATRKVTVPWTVIIHGEAGLNIDAIRAAIAAEIMKNTQYTQTEWEKLFPDIFGSTEFIFVPNFHHIALPDDAVNGGVYAPGGNITKDNAVAVKFVKGNGYTSAYMTANMNRYGFPYKSLSVAVIGGYRNRDGVNQFGDRWKDYINVSTSSIDFKRMSDETMDLVLTLNKMFQIAETMTATSAVPRGFMRLIREDILYVTATFQRTSLIVVSRQSILEKYKVGQGVTPVPA